MLDDKPIRDTGKMNEIFEKAVIEKLEVSIKGETEKYLRLSKGLREELADYKSKIEDRVKISNRSKFLFESIDTESNLFGQLEESLQGPDEQGLSGNMDMILQDILEFYELKKPDIKEAEDTTEEIPRPDGFARLTFYYLKQGFLFLKTKIVGEKLPENPNRNYVLTEVLARSLELNQEGFHALFSCISGLMMELWKISTLVQKKTDELMKLDYQMPEGDNFNSLDLDFSDITRLEEEVKKTLDSLLQSFSKSIHDGYEELKNNNFKLPVDHSESRKKYSNRHTKRVLVRTFKDTSSILSGWQRTLNLIIDDWLLELEIARLKYYILLQSFDFAGYIRTRYRQPLEETLRTTESIISELIGLFEEEASREEKHLIDEIKTIRINVKRKLVLKVVPEVKKIILDSNIPAQIDDFEQSTAQQFTQLSKSRSIKKHAVYNEPTVASDVDRISPASLVSFQMMPEFMDDFPVFKQGFTRHLLTVQNRMEEIPEIIDYSLLSTSNYAEEKKNIAEAEKIGLEGIKRAENKLHDIRKLINEFLAGETLKMKENIEKLAENLSEITDNESALQIKFRIAKARAIEKSKEYRKKLLDYFRNILPGLKENFNRLIQFLRESSIRIRKQFTLEDKRHFVSTDVSDYLTETEKAIDKLPFIYQRLFKTEPLTTFELYTERKEELEQLKLAYTRWKTGKFAPALIIGGKGWGKTTLVNRFLKSKITTEEVIRFLPDPTRSMDDSYSDLLSLIGEVNKKDASDDLVTGRKILVLDGLERLFEARISGFSAMTALLHLISENNHRIFWVVTCHQPAFQYLDKTLSVSDYFGYHIKLLDFSDEDLRKTIERRHSISGYRLMFMPETQKKSIISFKKQTDYGDQELLREEYFTRMQKIVRGNLSQAFLFWMRSTAYVTEDTVYIEYQSTEYFNFLGAMSDSKLMMLKYIVIQNGLSAEKYASLLRIPLKKSRLHLDQLHDDGVLVKKDEVYNINPIVYRQVIEQLYLMNILH